MRHVSTPRVNESERLKKARLAWLEALKKYEEQVTLFTTPATDIANKPFVMSVSTHGKLVADIQRCHDEYDKALEAEGRPVPHRKP